MSLVLSAVLAHPDDETFSGGGTFAKYAAAGVRCTLYCATDGDAGKTSGLVVNSREELGRVRRAELAAAAKILGFSAVESPGHPDGGLGAVDQQVLIAEVVRHLRKHRPQVVVTFGPEGAPNTHPDHRVISRATTAAFFLAANPTAFPEDLYQGLATHGPKRRSTSRGRRRRGARCTPRSACRPLCASTSGRTATARTRRGRST